MFVVAEIRSAGRKVGQTLEVKGEVCCHNSSRTVPLSRVPPGPCGFSIPTAGICFRRASPPHSTPLSSNRSQSLRCFCPTHLPSLRVCLCAVIQCSVHARPQDFYCSVNDSLLFHRQWIVRGICTAGL